MSSPWRCPDCGGTVFHRVKNGHNAGRQTFHRVCSACRPPRGPSNRNQQACVRDGTSDFAVDEKGRRRCRECTRRRSLEAYHNNLENRRARARRYQRERSAFDGWNDDEDPFLENHLALQKALGR